MGFTSVKIRGFRNLSTQSLIFTKKKIYLVGDNGQGKTNFLELIYFFCYGSSFKSKNDEKVIAHTSEYLYIEALYKSKKDTYPNKIEIGLNQNQKKIKFNNSNIIDRRDILNNIPCVIFCHSDIYFVNGSPENKRIYMDQCLSLNNPLYINYLRDYKKITKTRNFILKSKQNELYDVYSEQLVDSGFHIYKKRIKLVEYLDSQLNDYYRKITGLELDLKVIYSSNWGENKEKDEILTLVKNKKEKEFRYGSTLTGPHRDSFSIFSDKKNYIEIASTGQLRIISLILRILQCKFIKKFTKTPPVLLVDDVLLEIDYEKRKRMIDSFPEYEQIFYTFLDDQIELDKDSAIFDVKEGVLSERKEESRYNSLSVF